MGDRGAEDVMLVDARNGEDDQPQRRVGKCTKLFFILSAIGLSLYYTNMAYVSEYFSPGKGKIVSSVVGPMNYELLCYRDEKKQNAIRTLDENLVTKDESFFFIETKCHENNEFELTPRQACSIESVARLQSNSSVYVLVPSPVHQLKNSAHMRALLQSYGNIFVRHLNIPKYLKGTPLKSWNWERHLQTSKWPPAHASDVLRFLTLWKFGGTYLDADVILLRPLDRTNFAGAEDDDTIGSAVLSINKDHPINLMNLQDLKTKFNGAVWTNNGPDVILRSLRKLCRVNKTYDMTIDKCESFEVLPASKIYPIHWTDYELFFTLNEYMAYKTLNVMKESITVHFWNYMSYKQKVIVGSKQPYSVLASKHCPKVYSTLKNSF